MLSDTEVRPLPQHESEVKRQPAWFGMVALAAVLVEWMGFHWDFGWHGDIGRDSFFIPPHLMIISGLVSAAAVTSISFRRAGSIREWLRVQPGMAILGCGLILTATSLTIDNWWHSQFGLDVSAWAPSHLLLAFSFLFGVLGVITEIVTAGRVGPAMRSALIGPFVAISTIIVAEYELGYPHWRMLWHPVVLAVLLGFGMGLARVVGRHRWSGTLAASTAIGLRFIALGVNAAAGRSLLIPPLGILAGAVVFDLASRLTRRETAGRIDLALAVGAGWVAAFGAQWGWLQLAGKTWWTPAILIPGLLIGMAVSIVAGLAGQAVGASIRALVSVEARLHRRGPAWRPNLTALLAGAALGAAAAATAIGHVGVGRNLRPATYDARTAAVRLDVRHDSPDDWVSVIGPLKPTGVFATLAPSASAPTFRVIAGSYYPEVGGRRLRALAGLPRQLNVSWLGALSWHEGALEGSVRGSGEWFGLWYVHGDHVWAAVVERGTAGRISLLQQESQPPRKVPSWFVPLGSGVVGLAQFGAFVLAFIVLRLAVVSRTNWPTPAHIPKESLPVGALDRADRLRA